MAKGSLAYGGIVATSDVIFIDASANQGIGTVTPTATLEVEQSSGGGVIAFKVDNNDTDKVAVSIEAANIDADVMDISMDAVTTARGIDITADALTSGSAIYVDDNSPSTSGRNTVYIAQNHDTAIAATALSVLSDSGVTGMLLDKNFPAAAVAAATVRGLWIDFDHTVPESGTATMVDIGLDLDVNSAGLGTTTSTGIDLDVVGASSGTSTAVGINIAVGSADTNYALITSGGNVGINTASPGQALDIVGSEIRFTSSAINTPSFNMRNSNSDSLYLVVNQRTNAGGNIFGQARGGLQYINFNPNGIAAIGTGNAKDLVLASNDTERIRILSAGNVGIGVTAPASLLHVAGTVQVGVDGTGHDVKFFADTAGSFMFWNESEDRLQLTDSTYLSIGDSNDLQLVHNGSDSYITNAVGALKIADQTSGIAISIGHTTSETTINDNLTVTGNITVNGDLTSGVDGDGNDVIFYGDSASTNMTWDYNGNTAGELVLNDSRLYLNQDDDSIGILIDSEAASYAALVVYGKYGMIVEQDVSAGYGLSVSRNIAEGGSNVLVRITDDHTSNTQTTLRVQQDGTGDIMNLFDGGTEVMTVIDGGNIGLGDPTPQGMLEVNNRNTGTGCAVFIKGGEDDLSPIAGQYTGLAFGYGGGDTYNNTAIIHEFVSTTAMAKLHLCVNKSASDGTANISDAKLTIHTDGNVGIGSTTPGDSLPNGFATTGNETILEIGPGGVDQALTLRGHSGPHGLDIWTDISIGDCYIDQRGNHDTYDLRFRTKTSSSAVDVLTITGGGVFAGGGSADISDERLKENITTITGGLETINALTGRTFTWKEEAMMQSGTQYGFIAQEVETIIPDLVWNEDGIRKFDKDDNLIDMMTENDETNEYAKSVFASGIVPVLVEAVKELSVKNDALEAKVTALENA